MGKGEHFSDMETLQLIVDHCNKVEAVIDFLGKDFQKYEQSWWLKDIISMNILQIGERIHSNLTQNFKDAHPSIPWGDYIGIRNRFAHQYFTAADEIVWEGDGDNGYSDAFKILRRDFEGKGNGNSGKRAYYDKYWQVKTLKRKAAPQDGLSPSAWLTKPSRYSLTEAQPASACQMAFATTPARTATAKRTKV